MNDATLQSDYHFLEDVLQTVDGGKRLLKHVGAAASTQQQQQQHVHKSENDEESELPHPIMMRIQQTEEPPAKRQRTGSNNNKWQRLVHHADLRSTTLMLMPSGMQRHATNTTWYHIKTDTIYWKVDLNIHDADTNTQRLVSISKFDENATLQDEIVNKAGLNNTEHHLLLKQLPCPSNQPRFVELDRQTTLKNALRDQTVIEYPTIEVVPTKALQKFPRTIQEMK